MGYMGEDFIYQTWERGKGKERKIMRNVIN